MLGLQDHLLPLHAACARLGLTGQDQVRPQAQMRQPSTAGIHGIGRASSLACSVAGHIARAHVARMWASDSALIPPADPQPWTRHPCFSVIHARIGPGAIRHAWCCNLSCKDCDLYIELHGHAGATASVECSLCAAGTYLTGSGLHGPTDSLDQKSVDRSCLVL